MIDVKKMRERAATDAACGSLTHIMPQTLTELLDRLEVTERERDDYRHLSEKLQRDKNDRDALIAEKNDSYLRVRRERDDYRRPSDKYSDLWRAERDRADALKAPVERLKDIAKKKLSGLRERYSERLK